MTKKQQKNQLRERLLKLRSNMPEGRFTEKSAQICERLVTLPSFKQAKTVHCYVSINKRREVNTHPLIKEMLAAGKKVVVPVTQFKSGTLQHIEIELFEDLKPNKWHVLEPSRGKETPVDALDLVVVPMVGGDRAKNRIGYGKGFYDRFLNKVDCPTVGLLFEQCLADHIPVESFDVPLDMLITENEYIT